MKPNKFQSKFESVEPSTIIVLDQNYEMYYNRVHFCEETVVSLEKYYEFLRKMDKFLDERSAAFF